MFYISRIYSDCSSDIECQELYNNTNSNIRKLKKPMIDNNCLLLHEP